MSYGSNSSRIGMARSSSKWVDEYERGHNRGGKVTKKKVDTHKKARHEAGRAREQDWTNDRY